ncbi:MAG: winged helix-turn-helix transcriptional regulator [Candidatus Micrarchaeota archaeon]|nr:winged helix-turn-helix transcriptional regulator [Candidatus Micrarchaeota archaeon]MCX8154424.1 winged helix-turn-helix transcriptional regulator [Candidatus Micrarchaeota archaeon]
MRFDEVDELIIAEMKMNRRMKLKELSSSLGIPISTVHYRMKRLLKNNIIRKTININWKQIGYNVMGFLYVKVPDQFQNTDTLNSIKSLPYVEAVYSTIDDYNLVLLVRAKDNQSFEQNISTIRKLLPPNSSVRVVFGNER